MSLIEAPQPFLSNFLERVLRKWRRVRFRHQVRLVEILMKCHPFRVGDGSWPEGSPVHLLDANSHPANIFEEQEGDRAVQPFVEILLDLSPLMYPRTLRNLVSLIDSEAHLSSHFGSVKRLRLNSTDSVGVYRLNRIAKAESALETDPSETNRLKGLLIRVSEATQGCEMLFGEIFSVVREDEPPSSIDRVSVAPASSAFWSNSERT